MQPTPYDIDQITQEFRDLSWHRFSLVVKNIRNSFAKENPLSILDAVLKHARRRAGLSDEVHVFFHPVEATGSRVKKGKEYDLKIILIGGNDADAKALSKGFSDHLADPANNFSITQLEPAERRNLADLETGFNLGEPITELCLDFQTPIPFKQRKGKQRWHIDSSELNRILCNRLGRFLDLDYKRLKTAWAPLWENVTALPFYWNYAEFRHRSKSNRGKQYINGGFGPLYLKGTLTPLLPLLLLCSELHGGRRLSAGQGYFRLERGKPYFDALLLDHGRYFPALHQLEEKHDRMEEFVGSFQDRRELIDDTVENLDLEGFEGEVINHFSMEKKSGGKRDICSFGCRDMLVHRVLSNEMYHLWDRLLPSESIAYRKGKSTADARDFIAAAVGDGLRHLAETDIHDFFGSIDRTILKEKLDKLLPEGDTLTKEILEHAFSAAGANGIPQGFTLSPLLSNIYLADLDRSLREDAIRFVRYADDILILGSDAEAIAFSLEVLQERLAALGLAINEEKTRTLEVDEGLSFLGIDFSGDFDGGILDPVDMKRPLFLQQKYAFMGTDGEVITIKHKGENIGRIPFRRVGEIALFGGNSLSTRLVHRCLRKNIPLSFCSASGWHLGTLVPSGVTWYNTLARHSEKRADMTEQDEIQFGRALVKAKIGNHLDWLRRRYGKDDRQIKRLESRLAGVDRMNTLEQLRGAEGGAARIVFRAVHDLVCVSGFETSGRRPARKLDRYNALLDFGYSMLFSRLNVLVRGQGLNPFSGVLHSPKSRFESLVCDLQEPFRARVDRWVVTLLNRKVVTANDFEKYRETYRLKRKNMGELIESFEREMHVRRAGENGNWKTLVEAQVKAVAHWVSSDYPIEFYKACRPFECPWKGGRRSRQNSG